MKKTLLSLLLFINYFLFSQNTVGTTFINNDVYNGLTLFTSSTETFLINNCGQIINQWTSSFPPGNAVYLTGNGNLLRAGRTNSTDIVFGGQGGVVEIFDWNGNLTWQYFYDTPQHRQHHDVFPMPNGNILILAATVITNSEAIQAGRDPSLLPQSVLYNEQIIEVTPLGFNNATIVWEWNIKDHLIQDFDATKDNFGDISLNPNKLNINFLNGGSGDSNWLHINSIQYNVDLDQIVLSSRNLSEIYIIDHSTTTTEASTSSGGIYGLGGDFLFRWGNPQSYNQGTESDRKLYGQHYPHFIDTGLVDAGKIILFNNGNGRTPQFSEVFILDPLTSSPGFYTYVPNTAFGPVNPNFIYQDPIDPTNFYSHILSSAQRLPNGNILICEGRNGRFFEINSNNQMVWEYFNPVNSNDATIASQGDNPSTFSNVNFRAIKYSTSDPVFSGRDLTPNAPIETNPNISNCINTLENDDLNFKNTQIYPNPTNSIIKIESMKEINTIEVLSMSGQKIIEYYNNDKIDISKLQNGLYFLKISFDNTFILKKIIKE